MPFLLDNVSVILGVFEKYAVHKEGSPTLTRREMKKLIQKEFADIIRVSCNWGGGRVPSYDSITKLHGIGIAPGALLRRLQCQLLGQGGIGGGGFSQNWATAELEN